MTEEPRSTTARGASLVRIVLSTVVAIALLGVVASLADWGDLWQRLAGARLELLALSLVAYSVTYVARARRFAAAGARASTGTMLGIVAIHMAMNRIMPLKTGELSYPLLARRLGAAAIGQGLAQIVMLRIMDALTMAVLFLAALGLALATGTGGLGSSTPAFVVAACAIGAGSLLLLARLGAVIQALVRLGTRLAARSTGPFGARARRVLDTLDQAVASVTGLDLATRARIALWTAVSWIAYFVTFHCIMLALGVDVAFLSTCLGSSAAIVASSLPISGFGTFGALEGGWTLGFVAVGLDSATAASTAFAMSGLTLAFSLLLAAIAWTALSVRIAGGRRGPGP